MLHQNENKFPQFTFSDDEDSQSDEEVDPTIVIGYYNLRGKAQVPRLLCEYLHVDYRDELMSLMDWDRYKRTQTRKWDFKDLPFLKEGDFVVSEPTPMCVYLIKRFGSMDLLGKSLEDKSLVMMYVWTIQTMGNIVNINCQKKTPEELMEFKKNQWKNNVAPRLQKYEEVAKPDHWFLGYFTLIDLSMYELVRYMELIFPGELERFPKIKSIEQRVSVIPEIKNYELSDRAVRQTDPTTLLEELKRQRLQAQQEQPINETPKVDGQNSGAVENSKQIQSAQGSSNESLKKAVKGTTETTVSKSTAPNISGIMMSSNQISGNAPSQGGPFNTKATILADEIDQKKHSQFGHKASK